eukprot:scaffold4614_cov247-Pinguiococcus_pyrenoidosus.AAC.10
MERWARSQRGVERRCAKENELRRRRDRQEYHRAQRLQKGPLSIWSADHRCGPPQEAKLAETRRAREAELARQERARRERRRRTALAAKERAEAAMQAALAAQREDLEKSRIQMIRRQKWQEEVRRAEQRKAAAWAATRTLKGRERNHECRWRGCIVKKRPCGRQSRSDGRRNGASKKSANSICKKFGAPAMACDRKSRCTFPGTRLCETPAPSSQPGGPSFSPRGLDHYPCIVLERPPQGRLLPLPSRQPDFRRQRELSEDRFGQAGRHGRGRDEKQDSLGRQCARAPAGPKNQCALHASHKER